MSKEENPVLAMYDIRGIQDYIFRTAKIKDAIGASAIVEDIIEKALDESIKKAGINDSEIDLKWFDNDGPLPYEEKELKVQVLYIGGGNAYVIYENEELAKHVSKLMARYTLEKTYSLQLATAFVEKTDDYQQNFRDLRDKMTKIKERMIVSKPLGPLPIVEIEKKTGFSVTETKNGDNGSELRLSTESFKKKKAGEKKRKLDGFIGEDTILDSYITKKDSDSMIAVVHIDGNNMGNRINHLIRDKELYIDAVNLMREISFNINSSYKNVFNEMATYFNDTAKDREVFKDKDKKDCFVMKVLTAGDDITYVCNAKIALASVEYFVNKITQKGMLNEDDKNQYRFSVCGGIAYINSHFPFDVGYEVAEECCQTAKERAKESKNKMGDLVGNWVDFQICKNIHTKDLKETRRREYLTKSGESLCLRPYFIFPERAESHNSTTADKDRFVELSQSELSYNVLKNAVEYVSGNAAIDGKTLPRSFAKSLRNVYPLGEATVTELVSFITSRMSVPNDMYCNIDGKKVAKYYDALEIMDYFVDIRDGEEAKEE